MENSYSKSHTSERSERQLKVHNVFLKLAIQFSALSYANRAKQGCVIVDQASRIVSTGFNGTPHGVDNACEKDDVTLPYVIHAEANAILNSTKADLSGCTLYVTQSPCIACAAIILQKGIKNVYYHKDYRVKDGRLFLEQHGIHVERLTITI
jgi:dCMP deaminase